MKILITGGSGMVGRNLLEHEDIKLKKVYAPSSSELNLMNYDNVVSYLKELKPDFIIHCAGKVGGIQANMKDMYGFLSHNLIMGVNLVRAAKECSIKNLLNLSSSCSYPKDVEGTLSEEMILAGQLEPTNEGYAIAKVTVLKMCQYLTEQSNGDYLYKTLVPCNLYGRWDKFDPKHSHMIPAVIRKIDEAVDGNHKSLDIWGDGNARREFMYTGDLADCISNAVDNFDSLPIVMNCGLGYDYSINEYYSIIAEVIGYNGEFTHDLTKPVGMKRKLLNTSIQENWGWSPKLSLKEGIEKTYKFYKKMENLK